MEAGKITKPRCIGNIIQKTIENTSGDTWTAKRPDGATKKTSPGETVPIIDGLGIEFNNTIGKIKKQQ